MSTEAKGMEGRRDEHKYIQSRTNNCATMPGSMVASVGEAETQDRAPAAVRVQRRRSATCPAGMVASSERVLTRSLGTRCGRGATDLWTGGGSSCLTPSRLLLDRGSAGEGARSLSPETVRRLASQHPERLPPRVQNMRFLRWHPAVVDAWLRPAEKRVGRPRQA